jgi:PAS domain S-box-containing protein
MNKHNKSQSDPDLRWEKRPMSADEQQLRMMFDSMTEGLALNEIVYDDKGEMIDYRILNVNRAYYSIADYTGTQVIGNIATRLYGMTREFIQSFWKDHRQKNTTSITEMWSPLNKKCFIIAISPFVEDKFVTSFMDITERKQMEAAQREGEEKWRSLVMTMPDYVAIHDRDGKYLFVNHYADGFTEKDVIGRSIYDFISPKDKPLFKQRIDNLQKTGELQQFEFLGLGAQGKLREYEETLVPLKSSNGENNMLAFARDITEHKQVEDRLHESEERYRDLVENSHELIYTHDLNGKLLSVNHTAALMLGYNPITLVGRNLGELLAPEQRMQFKDYLDRIRRKASDTGTWVLQSATGDRRTWEYHSMIRPDAKQGSYARGMAHDITERMRVESALRESEERFQKIFDEGPIGMVLTSHYLQFFKANPAFCRMLGYAIDEMNSQTFLEVTHPEHREQDRQNMEKLWQGEIPEYRTQKRYIAKNGSIRWGSLSISILRGQDGEPQYALSIVEDITKRKRAEEDLVVQLRFEKLISDLIARFVNVAPEHLDDEIMEALRLVCEGLDLDRSVLYQSPKSQPGAMLVTYRYQTQEGAHFPEPKTDASELFPWVVFKVLSGETVIISKLADLPAEASRDLESFRQIGTQSSVIVPLSTGGGTIAGGCSFGSIHAEQTWSDPIIKRLQLIALVFANALARKQAEEAILRRNAELTALNQIGQALNKLAKLDDILELIFTVIGQVLDNRNLFIALYDRSSQTISFPVYAINSKRIFGGDRPLSNGITDYIIRTNTPLLVKHNLAEALAQRGIDLIGTASRSFMAVPMCLGDKVIGVIALQDYDRENAYDEQQLELLTTMAAQASTALENARLFDQVQQELEERKQAEEVLRESETRYRAVFEGVEDAIFIESLDSRILDANRRACEMFGYSHAEFLTKTVANLVPSRDYIVAFNPSESPTLPIHPFETINVRANGEQFPIELNFSIQTINGEQVLFVVGRDISERKRSEHSLRQSEARYRAILEQAAVGISQADSVTGEYIDINQKFCDIVGYSRDEILGNTFQNITHPDDLGADLEYMRQLRAGKIRTFSMEKRYYRKDKSIIWVNLTVSPLWAIGEEPRSHVAVVEDITERKQAEMELAQSHEQLRALGQYLQAAREEERTFIAREIHDELGQELTALKMDLAWLSRQLPPEQTHLVQKTAAISNMVDGTIQTVRRVASQLRPGLLDDLGLVAALEWQAGEFQARTGIACSLDLPENVSTLSQDQATAIFRVFQETLTNITRHAQATRVRITLKDYSDSIELTVRDNGIGITQDQLTDPRSLGLTGMRERVQAFGGSLKFKSATGKGPTVRVTMPVLNMPLDKEA